MELKRSSLSGALLRPLGLSSWGAQQTETGISFLGGTRDQVRFSDWAGPVELVSTLGFPTLAVPLTDGSVAKLAGIKPKEAARFISSANDAFREHIVRQFEGAEAELSALGEAIDRLDNPRRYPAACLLAPFLARANTVIHSLPATIRYGFLPAAKQKLLDTVRDFNKLPEPARQAAIQKFIAAELAAMQPFFDKIESNPLTPEQRLAVVTDEDATLVLAGAGSGKTSVIVAKAAYLIERGVRAPEEILLLAFGKDAAAEMANRIQERAGATVDAMTFHALGNKIICEVEGTGPALAEHASDEVKFRALLRDILINEVAAIAGLGSLLLDWFSAFYFPYKSEWDFKTLDQYYQWVESHDLRTLNGDRVKSFEEWEISNWLYRNGIAFEYEPLYDKPLPHDARGAYRPDFRLTESGIYIEHFGVRKERGPDGSTRLTTAPHIDRERYLADMEWKRDVHRANDTTLIETFSYEKVEGQLLDNLREKLAPHVKFAPIPESQMFSVLSELGQVDAFTQTLGTFLRHFKSAGTTIAQCQERGEASADVPRSRSFMRIFEPLFEAYEARLGDMIDFEDMIIRAAEHVESGRYQSPYRHLLVDEFQDISEGRARLLRALKSQHADARLFAVGDDWQSIYRFTGADIHLMRNFGKEFGGTFAEQAGVHSTVDLGRTFRSVDKIAEPARSFVLRNPAQIKKTVIAAGTATAPAIMVAYHRRGQHEAALKASLTRLAANAPQGASVLLLGRYRHTSPTSMAALKAEFPDLTIRFMTVHASKGLEADHVIILHAVSDKLGFPSEIVDDPLLDLVLPEPERFEHAEERRLFYVALTRARKSVTILADREKPSAFARELVETSAYGAIEVGEPGIAEHRCPSCGGRMLAQTGRSGGTYFACEHRPLCNHTLKPCTSCGNDLPIKDKTRADRLICSCSATFPACPLCADGWLVERTGRYGKFLGCVNYPDCTGKQQAPDRQ